MDETDPVAATLGRGDFRLGGVAPFGRVVPRCPIERVWQGLCIAWQVGWGSRLHHPIRSPAAAPARDRFIPLSSTADILDSSARTCSP